MKVKQKLEKTGKQYIKELGKGHIQRNQEKTTRTIKKYSGNEDKEDIKGIRKVRHLRYKRIKKRTQYNGIRKRT